MLSRRFGFPTVVVAVVAIGGMSFSAAAGAGGTATTSASKKTKFTFNGSAKDGKNAKGKVSGKFGKGTFKGTLGVQTEGTAPVSTLKLTFKYKGGTQSVSAKLNASFVGTWKYTKGTGKWRGIKGGGKLAGKATSPTSVQVTFTGKYS